MQRGSEQSVWSHFLFHRSHSTDIRVQGYGFFFTPRTRPPTRTNAAHRRLAFKQISPELRCSVLKGSSSCHKAARKFRCCHRFSQPAVAPQSQQQPHFLPRHSQQPCHSTTVNPTPPRRTSKTKRTVVCAELKRGTKAKARKVSICPYGKPGPQKTSAFCRCFLLLLHHHQLWRYPHPRLFPHYPRRLRTKGWSWIPKPSAGNDHAKKSTSTTPNRPPATKAQEHSPADMTVNSKNNRKLWTWS